MKSKQCERFIEIMFRFNKLVKNHMNEVTKASKSEFCMLHLLHNELERMNQQEMKVPGIKVSDLTKKLHHSMPATSKMLNTLEEKGYIERHLSPKDRRAVYITLTEIGIKKTEEISDKLDEFTNRVLEEMGDDNIEQLFLQMNRLYSIMEQEILHFDREEKE